MHPHRFPPRIPVIATISFAEESSIWLLDIDVKNHELEVFIEEGVASKVEGTIADIGKVDLYKVEGIIKCNKANRIRTIEVTMEYHESSGKWYGLYLSVDDGWSRLPFPSKSLEKD